MAVNYEEQAEKKQVPLWAVAVAGVALLAFVIWWGIRSLAPPTYPKTPAQVTYEKRITELAVKCQGDFSKLSSEEQAEVTKQSGPMAATTIKAYYSKAH